MLQQVGIGISGVANAAARRGGNAIVPHRRRAPALLELVRTRLEFQEVSTYLHQPSSAGRCNSLVGSADQMRHRRDEWLRARVRAAIALTRSALDELRTAAPSAMLRPWEGSVGLYQDRIHARGIQMSWFEVCLGSRIRPRASRYSPSVDGP